VRRVAKPKTVVVLGAQRFEPSLGAAVAEAGVKGRIAVITAGWQERESEDEELAAHLGGRTVNLRLHARGEEVFAEDPELRAAHRERQESLRHRQDYYRIRLELAMEADRMIRQREPPGELAEEELDASVATLRGLDQRHFAQCEKEHEQFDAQWSERPSVKKHREEIARIVDGCEAICIAGGHVASLLNRLTLFGIGELFSGRSIFAWSAGAMAVSDRVVLFHDDPPQGPGASEVLDAGLGLCPDAVFFPEPEKRLRVDQKQRMALLARRFAPATCLLLPARSRIAWRNGKFLNGTGVQRLKPSGEAVPFPEEPATGGARRAQP
jgi:hypothetical protein